MGAVDNRYATGRLDLAKSLRTAAQACTDRMTPYYNALVALLPLPLPPGDGSPKLAGGIALDEIECDSDLILVSCSEEEEEDDDEDGEGEDDRSQSQGSLMNVNSGKGADESEGNTPDRSEAHQKRGRSFIACESCKASKTKWVPNTDVPTSTCVHCLSYAGLSETCMKGRRPGPLIAIRGVDEERELIQATADEWTKCAKG